VSGAEGRYESASPLQRLAPVAETVRLLVLRTPYGEAYVSIFVIPAPHCVRDKLQRESSFFALAPCSFDPFDYAQGRLRSGQVSQG